MMQLLGLLDSKAFRSCVLWLLSYATSSRPAGRLISLQILGRLLTDGPVLSPHQEQVGPKRIRIQHYRLEDRSGSSLQILGFLLTDGPVLSPQQEQVGPKRGQWIVFLQCFGSVFILYGSGIQHFRREYRSGSRVLMTQNLKNLQLKIVTFFFWSKTPIYSILRPP